MENLFNACIAGDLKTVKNLVEDGIYFQEFDNKALCLACCNGRLDIVKYLVEKGADIHANNNHIVQSYVFLHLAISTVVISSQVSFRPSQTHISLLIRFLWQILTRLEN